MLGAIIMYFLKHTDEPPIVFEELPEYIVSLCEDEVYAAEGQPTPASTDSTEDMTDWLASDEAAFLMSL